MVCDMEKCDALWIYGLIKIKRKTPEMVNYHYLDNYLVIYWALTLCSPGAGDFCDFFMHVGKGCNFNLCAV